MLAQIGNRAPNLSVSKWVQGRPTNIDKERGNVVLVEVFQVNCPGCFTYGIPQAVDMYKKYYNNDLRVLGVATAFEDFDKNTLENLKLLLTTGEVIGAPRRVLGEYGRLAPGNKIGYKIPFPVAMDTLLEIGPLTDDNVTDFIEANFRDFRSYIVKEQESIYERAKQYLKLKQFSAKTFEEYGLRGTPSAILIDKKGVLRQTFFGSNNSLEGTVKELLNE
ncbi:MAG: TlpA family protein disulfide reductase [Candidatus Nitrosopolaris sp.]